MVTENLNNQLHDRATRGEPLSPEEKTQLEKWYAVQDNAEDKEWRLTAQEKPLTALQAQVDSALVQLIAVTKRIQEIATENETLRREIVALRHQVAQLLGAQPA